MKEVSIQYPYIDENGNEHYDKIKFYCEGHKIINIITGMLYSEAVEKFPSNSKYSVIENDDFLEEAENTEEYVN